MHLRSPKVPQLHRISYQSVPDSKPLASRFKTQPYQITNVSSKRLLKNQQIKNTTSDNIDSNQMNKGIFMRRVRQYNRKSQNKRDPLPQKNTKNISNDRNIQHHNLELISTHRETQRQRFIKQLKSRVLRSENTSFLQNETSRQKIISCKRYQKQKTSSHINISPPKSNHSQEEFIPKEQFQFVQTRNRKQSCQNSLLQINSAIEIESHQTMRNRSKTFVKDFSKIVEENLNFRHKNVANDYSRTIQASNFESKLKLSQSLDQIQKLQKIRVSPHAISPKTILTNDMVGILVPSNTSKEEVEIDSDVTNRSKTQQYEDQVKQLTNEFLTEWDKMNSTKSQLYQKFRNKLVKQYPSMRKRYKDNEVEPAEPNLQLKKKISDYMSPALQSSIKISFKHKDSNISGNNYSINNFQGNNYLTVTQLKVQAQKMQRQGEKQKQELKEIFKQAYFWSKTKGKYYSEKYRKDDDDIEEQRQIGNIKKNMTFMNYLKKKDVQPNTTHKKKIKGSNIIKNKQCILQIEKEGSPQQSFLKKCLDDAIQDCING